MKTTLSWLKDFVPIRKSPEDVAKILTHAGLPVTSVEDLSSSVQGIVIGKIMKIERHPRADRLTVCQVDVGKETLKIVCGATNMKEGDLVPVAMVGCALPDSRRIEQATIRGETSFGMMCSKKELGLGEDQGGLYLLPASAVVGKTLAETLGRNDVLLDVEVTPNRSDCLSTLGIAREISAITNVPMRPAKQRLDVRDKGTPWNIEVIAKDHCWNYCGCVLEGVKVASSPEWLKNRLEQVGIRSINNIVDVTNYILLGHGQPLHAFDADTLQDKKIVVRLAQEGETIMTIDRDKRILDSEMLVIADGQRPVAIAGIMGGADTEVRNTTRRILLESAMFAPQSIRRTSKKLGLVSESSFRFERGVDPGNVLPAMQDAIALLSSLADAKPGPIRKVFAKKISTRKVALDIPRASRLLGVKVSSKAARAILQRLHFTVTGSAKKLVAEVPSYRWDIQGPADLIEEIARIEGYEKIPISIPRSQISAPSGSVAPDREAREVLLAAGFTEVLHLSFFGANRLERLGPHCAWGNSLVEIENPIDQDQRYLRPTLLDALLDNLVLNQNRAIEDSYLFEIGEAFSTEGGRIHEKKALAIAALGSIPGIQWQGKKRDFDFYDLKGVVEAVCEALGFASVTYPISKSTLFQPGQGCTIEADGHRIGHLGKVHASITQLYGLRQDAFIAEIDRRPAGGSIATPRKQYHPVSKFPPITRDIALVLDRGVTAGEVTSFLQGHKEGILEEVMLFDQYEGKNIPQGKKSLAFRLRYRSDERTLKEIEVQAEHQRILDGLRSKWGCEPREA